MEKITKPLLLVGLTLGVAALALATSRKAPPPVREDARPAAAEMDTWFI